MHTPSHESALGPVPGVPEATNIAGGLATIAVAAVSVWVIWEIGKKLFGSR